LRDRLLKFAVQRLGPLLASGWGRRTP
jgi:hypothetical protein